MRKQQYESPVVLWDSYWKEYGTEIKILKGGEQREVKVYALYGTPNKNYKKDKGENNE